MAGLAPAIHGLRRRAMLKAPIAPCFYKGMSTQAWMIGARPVMTAEKFVIKRMNRTAVGMTAERFVIIKTMKTIIAAR